MPYEIVCDGQLVDLGKTQYLLSPQDLAAYDLIPRLIELGVSSLKIEGRLKSPEYVANITRHYRQAIDAAWAGEPVEFTPRDVEEMQLSFSRGFSHGFLDGQQPQGPGPRRLRQEAGHLPGRVQCRDAAGCVRLALPTAVKPGDGLVLDGDEADGLPEQGGRVYEVFRRPLAGRIVPSAGRASLRPRCDSTCQVHPGQGVWKTDDPELTGRLRQSFEGPPAAARRLWTSASRADSRTSHSQIEARTVDRLTLRVEPEARWHRRDRQPADEALLRDQLGRLGGTIYRLRALEASIAGDPHGAQEPAEPASPRPGGPKFDDLRPPSPRAADRRRLSCRSCWLRCLMSAPSGQETEGRPVSASRELSVLCRRTDQFEAAVRGRASRTIYADYQDIKEYADAVAAARRGGAAIYLATPADREALRGEPLPLPGEARADGILVRNAGGLYFCAERAIPFVADFSLNAANALTVELFRAAGRNSGHGLVRSERRPARRPDRCRPAGLARGRDPSADPDVPHGALRLLCRSSRPAPTAPTAARPCDHHDVKLRDRVGVEHPLKADVGCRNTLFNAVPQTAAEYLPRLGVARPAAPSDRVP